MKGHDDLCPTPNPGVLDTKNCTYCNLIEKVKDYYKDKKNFGNDKTYDEGYANGWNAAIAKLQEMNGVQNGR